jgi:hypothetical protein
VSWLKRRREAKQHLALLDASNSKGCETLVIYLAVSAKLLNEGDPSVVDTLAEVAARRARETAKERMGL